MESSLPRIWTDKLQKCPYLLQGTRGTSSSGTLEGWDSKAPVGSVKVPEVINNSPTAQDKISQLTVPLSLLRTEETREGSPKNHEFPPCREKDKASNRKGAKAAEQAGVGGGRCPESSTFHFSYPIKLQKEQLHPPSSRALPPAVRNQQTSLPMLVQSLAHGAHLPYQTAVNNGILKTSKS